MEEVLKEISERLNTLTKSMEYQQKLLEEIMMSRDEHLKNNKERVTSLFKKYRETMMESPIMKANPEASKAMESLFEGIIPPEG